MTQVKTKSENTREAQYEVNPLFINRWSPRSFLEKEVPEADLLSVFEAARWAPSANNFQPWRFIVAKSEADLKLFHTFINPGNLVWCEKAPVLTLLISKKTTDNGENRYHAFDSGTAFGYLALEAANKGLVTHAMGGFDRDKAREALQIPDDYEIQCVIAIGYQGEKEVLPENLQEREQPNNRRPLADTLFNGKFNQTLV
ncbi:nitroreductase family protein [Fredinandcohnia sp. 179-A 10B2 NHS]|uniref:nitroreductase family protein n=1 Tax=Fredinandcohnia sp. 179-A 10B2 NHS TaxID=3235176 RepID=UPI0039A1CE84